MSQSTLDIIADAIRDSFNSNDIDPYPIAKAALEAMRVLVKNDPICNQTDDLLLQRYIDNALNK